MGKRKAAETRLVETEEHPDSATHRPTPSDAKQHPPSDEATSLDGVERDPYLLKEATYIKKDPRWRNKQRCLVFTSRGITHRYRHLVLDIKRLMPHHKDEAKWEKKQTFSDINELCDLQSCSSTLFFEARKHTELYMWASKTPTGPSVKFQVLNVHTMEELKLTGNCLLCSRPLLSFDYEFGQLPQLKLIRELFIQIFGTPRNHPKAKPFHDHVLHFHWTDNKIWLRHYQISPVNPEKDENKPENVELIEIGPRLVLDPIRLFEGSFGGATLWHNPSYISPVQIRAQMRTKHAIAYKKRKLAKERRSSDHAPLSGEDVGEEDE